MSDFLSKNISNSIANHIKKMSERQTENELRNIIADITDEKLKLISEVERLQAENAALSARIDKFDDLHIHMGEAIYIITDNNEIIERFICGVHILSTEIIFVTTTQKNYKSCNKKGIAAHIAHGFENSFGLLPLRDFGERAFIHRESALVRLTELKGGKE